MPTKPKAITPSLFSPKLIKASPALKKSGGTDKTGEKKILAQAQQKKYNRNQRSESVQKVLHRLFIVFIIIATAIVIAVVGVRLVHLALPFKMQWLNPEQLQLIDKLFFSGTIGGFIVSYFRKASK